MVQQIGNNAIGAQKRKGTTDLACFLQRNLHLFWSLKYVYKGTRG